MNGLIEGLGVFMRVSVMATTACLCLTAMASAAEVKAAIRQPTNIPAQPLAQALQALASDRDFQILYLSDVVAGMRAQAVSGALTRDEVLQRWLSGTALTFQYLDDETVTIVPRAQALPRASDQSAASPGSPTLKWSQRNESTHRRNWWEWLRLAQAGPGESGASASPRRASADADSMPDSEVLSEIVVVGSRLSSPNTEQAQPIRVMDRAAIERSGAASIAQALNNLTEVSINSTTAPNQTGRASQTVQLRGLPSGTALVLLNGRRLLSTPWQSGSGITNLNVLPLAAVERIEVLPSGSSAVYGGDALAGVVNIVLKADFDGFDINTRYGAADGYSERQGALSWGRQFSRGSVSLLASYSDNTELQGLERAITANYDYRRFGGPDLSTPFSNPGNVYSLSGQNLPGLATQSAGIPHGTDGIGLTSADFQASDGVLNMNPFFGSLKSERPPTEQYSGLLSGTFALTDRTELFAELLYARFQAQEIDYPYYMSGQFGSYRVPATNPFNPFGVDVGINYLFEGAGRFCYCLTQQYTRPLVGLRGTLGNWSWETAATMTRGLDQQREGPFLDPVKVNAALADSDPATALNPFADRTWTFDEIAPYMYSLPSDLTGEQYTLDGFIRGPLFSLPGGPVEVVVGAELDRAKLDYAYYVTFFKGDRHQSASFAEVRVPVLGPGADGGGERIALTGALRYDDYSDFGSRTSPQLGIEVRPMRSLLMRATYSSAYKPPTLYDLNQPLIALPGIPIVDPLRNDESYAITYRIGGNPHLKALTGESTTAGLVFTPERLPGLELTGSYWTTRIENYSSHFGEDVLLGNPELFGSYVVRAAPTPADVAAGLPGRVTELSNLTVNYGEFDLAGVDLGVRWRRPVGAGEWITSIAASHTHKYDAALVPGQPAQNRAGKANTQGFAPEWKGNISMSWDTPVLQTSLTARYTGNYEDYRTTRSLGNFWLIDGHVRYEIGKALAQRSRYLGGTYVSIGVVNLFNKLPVFSYSSSNQGYDPRQYDIRGRFVYLQLGAKL